jgi:hypothetical protein
MINLYLGTDRDKARVAMNRAVTKAAQGGEIIRITDAHTVDDLRTALQGGGMFGGNRVLVFEGVCANPDLCDVMLPALQSLAQGHEDAFIYEEKPLTDLRKKLEKHAENIEKFDAPKKERGTDIFILANALRKGDKKALWVGYMQEVGRGSAPEMVHGLLFWAAKDMVLKAEASAASRTRAAKLVADLTELPHEARRRGEDIEYALERFALAQA